MRPWMLAFLGIGGFFFVMSVAFVEPNGWTTGILSGLVFGGLAGLGALAVTALKRRLERQE